MSLAEAIPVADRDKAIEECIAAAVPIPRGRWTGHRTDSTPDGIGLLVLHGLLVRHVGVSGSFGAELLGQGDLLRPWQGEGVPVTPPQATRWRVLEPTRVAVLDLEVARRFARYPELTGSLVARALERARRLATNMAIVHQARVHVRLHMLLWHLADRWGYVRPEGTILPLRLTQDLLADLVAAQRPTVSSALSQLTTNELVRLGSEGWLLSGQPPGELLQLQELSAGGARLLAPSTRKS